MTNNANNSDVRSEIPKMINIEELQGLHGNLIS